VCVTQAQSRASNRKCLRRVDVPPHAVRPVSLGYKCSGHAATVADRPERHLPFHAAAPNRRSVRHPHVSNRRQVVCYKSNEGAHVASSVSS